MHHLTYLPFIGPKKIVLYVFKLLSAHLKDSSHHVIDSIKLLKISAWLGVTVFKIFMSIFCYFF